MGRQDGMLILALAELLNGKLVESRIIEQSLKLLCEAFTFDGALLYELDQYKQMCLKEQYLQFPFSPPEHFVLSELTPAYCELLARQTLLLVSESDQNSADEKVLLTMFGCRSLVVAAVVDEGLSVYGLLIFARREPQAAADSAERLLQTALSMFGRYVGMRVYKNKLSFAQNALESILDNTGIDIYVNDFQTHDILYANKSMAAPYGGISQFMGRKCWEVLFPGQGGECEFCPQKHLIDENGEPTKIYTWDYQRPFDGSWFRVFSAAFRWVDGRLAHVVSSADITDNKRNEELVEYLANYDSLTNLPNRRMLVKECERRISRTQKGDTGYLLFFDIDRFKAINDTLGHSSGDEFLVQLGQFFAGIPLLKNAIYRNGGDEFIAIIDGDKTEANIRNLVGFIHRRFTQPWHLQKGDIFCNVSIGVARYPEDGQTPEALLSKADQAMYKVKKTGGKAILFGYEL